jgi:hypothetical protein
MLADCDKEELICSITAEVLKGVKGAVAGEKPPGFQDGQQ